MTRHSLRASVCVTLLLLLLAGCSGFTPSDEPLPTVAELRAEFAQPAARQGVLVDGGTRYQTTAEHSASDDTSRLRINLVSADSAEALTVLIEGRQRPDLREGAELTVSFLYSGTSDGSQGNGILGITSVEGDRIAGVFAADLVPNGLVPQFPRIRGAFNATRTEPPR